MCACWGLQGVSCAKPGPDSNPGFSARFHALSQRRHSLRMLQFTPCDAEVSSPGASPKWRNRFQLIHSRECTDNKLIPQKDPVQFRPAHVTTRAIRQCFPFVFVPFGSTVGCLCAREWEVSKVEASLSTSDFYGRGDCSHKKRARRCAGEDRHSHRSARFTIARAGLRADPNRHCGRTAAGG